MRLSSTADPLPTRFLARRIRLSAGSAKRAQSIDIARSFGVEGRFSRAETVFSAVDRGIGGSGSGHDPTLRRVTREIDRVAALARAPLARVPKCDATRRRAGF